MVSLIQCFSSIFRRSPRNSKKKGSQTDLHISNLVTQYPANPTQHPELHEISNYLTNVIAFVNPKSGGQKGRVIFEKLKNYLHKDNIFDLSNGGPSLGLKHHRDRKDLKVIACGGDGTVGWVLSGIDEIDFGDNKPPVAILPLGTGNDLARTLNWGGGYNNDIIEDYLKKVISSSLVKLDRWTIETKVLSSSTSNISTLNDDDSEKSFGDKAKDKLPLCVMNNYFSIGADAKIALDFHEAREKNPAAFSSQTVNKIEYAKNYGKDLFQLSCKNITDLIEVFECDGKNYLGELHRESYHSIVFLNIPSFAGGQKPWKNDANNIQSTEDKKLEIIGFKTQDFMKLALGGHGDRITQATKIKIKTKGNLPMQVDGEPVLLKASELTIDFKNQANMLNASSSSTNLAYI